MIHQINTKEKTQSLENILKNIIALNIMLDHVVVGFYRDSHQILLFMSPQENYQINELSACSKIHKTIIFFLHTC